MDIYGQYKDSLEAVMRMMAASMERYAKAHKDDSGELIYEHLRYRLKSEKDRKSTRLNSSHPTTSRMPSSA